ncbi:hypothetical protein D3C72_1800590 [compost metagenome]
MLGALKDDTDRIRLNGPQARPPHSIQLSLDRGVKKAESRAIRRGRLRVFHSLQAERSEIVIPSPLSGHGRIGLFSLFDLHRFRVYILLDPGADQQLAPVRRRILLQDRQKAHVRLHSVSWRSEVV